MEISGLDSSEKRVVCSYLNRLAVACRDDVIARSATTRAILTVEEREAIEAQVGRRFDFIDELHELVLRHGGRFMHRGSHLFRAHQVLHELGVFVTGRHLGDEYERCSRAETRAARIYDEVLDHDLPPAVRLVLERQQEEIVQDRDALRQLRYLH